MIGNGKKWVFFVCLKLEALLLWNGLFFFPYLASENDNGFLGLCNGCLFIYFVMHDYMNTNCAGIVKFYKLQSLSLGRDYISFTVEVRGFVCEIVIFSPAWLVKMIAIFGLCDGCLLINLVMNDCKVGNCASTIIYCKLQPLFWV